MAKGKKFDKKSATTYSVVHRSHEDSLYYDNDASRHVLVPLPNRQKKGENGPGPADVPDSEVPELFDEKKHTQLRENEGYAAQYGIFYDDSKYDYLQHLKPMGQEGGVFIEATVKKAGKPRLEDLLRDNLPSESTRKVALDETENIPEDLRGFNPDMDPRLREVLEALEDEAYLEETEEGQEDDDVFGDLLRSGEAGDNDYYGEDEDQYFDSEEYDEWDMDNHQDEFDRYDQYDSDYVEHEEGHGKELGQTTHKSQPKSQSQTKHQSLGEEIIMENPYNEGEAPDATFADAAKVNTAWEKDFKRFVRSNNSKPNDWDSDNEFEDEEEEEADALGDLPAIAGKKKKKNVLRKKMGAMTDTSAFSMSSSANFRTQGLMLLDDRYEQMANKFEEFSERTTEEFSYENERPDLENMLDEFLDTYELDRGGRRLMKKDPKLDAIKQAADSASNSKLAARRRKEQLAVGSLGSSFGKMTL